MLDMTVQDVLLTPFGAFFEVQVPFILGHVEKGEKSKRFSYPDYFTYPDSQHWRLGQRCPDNRGCTVFKFVSFPPNNQGRGETWRELGLEAEVALEKIHCNWQSFPIKGIS